MQGVDVSSHNPPQDWHLLVEQGVQFAGVRISYGTTRDVAAEAHLTAAYAAGIRLFVGYHFETMSPAQRQASTFVERATELELLLGCEMGLAVDLEDVPNKPPWPREPYEACARETMEHVRAAKHRPCGVYLSPTFARELDLSWWFADSPLWLARWASTPGQIPKPWTQITLWQNAVKPGPDGALDRDVFHGTADDFRAAFGLQRWTAPHDVLGRIVETSNAAAGRCSSKAEDFCEK